MGARPAFFAASIPCQTSVDITAARDVRISVPFHRVKADIDTTKALPLSSTCCIFAQQHAVGRHCDITNAADGFECDGSSDTTPRRTSGSPPVSRTLLMPIPHTGTHDIFDFLKRNNIKVLFFLDMPCSGIQ